MTEKSFFYDGTTLGDASLAPYDAQTFTEVRSLLLTSNQDVVFDAGSSGNAMAVLPNAGMVIEVDTGSAMLGGYYFSPVNRFHTVSTNTSGVPRIDRVVVRVNWIKRTSELAIKLGQPSVVPEPPALSLDRDGVYEMSLARIYVPSGLAAITAMHITDERQIMPTPAAATISSSENIFPNSEFIAPAGTGDSGNNVPAMWVDEGVTSCQREQKFPSMRRGSTVRVNAGLGAGTNRGIAIRMPMGGTFTLRFLLEVYEGIVWIGTSGSGGAGTLWVPPTNGPVEIIIRDNISLLNLFIGKHTTTAEQTSFRIGQVTLACGNAVAKEQATRETILFGNTVTVWAFGAIPTDFIDTSDLLASGFRQLLAQIVYRDAGSAGTDTSYFYLGIPTNQLRVEVGRLPNNSLRAVQGFVSPQLLNAAKTFNYRLLYGSLGGGVKNVGIYYIGCTT